MIIKLPVYHLWQCFKGQSISSDRVYHPIIFRLLIFHNFSWLLIKLQYDRNETTRYILVETNQSVLVMWYLFATFSGGVYYMVPISFYITYNTVLKVEFILLYLGQRTLLVYLCSIQSVHAYFLFFVVVNLNCLIFWYCAED